MPIGRDTTIGGDLIFGYSESMHSASFFLRFDSLLHLHFNNCHFEKKMLHLKDSFLILIIKKTVQCLAIHLILLYEAKQNFLSKLKKLFCSSIYHIERLTLLE